MYINKFIGHRQSGKTKFLCNIGKAFLGERPEDVTAQKKAGFPRLVQSYDAANNRMGLFIVPTRREISDIKKEFFTDLRMHICCVDDIIDGGAGMGRVYNIILIDNVERIPKHKYHQMLSLFKKKDNFIYVTYDAESYKLDEENIKSAYFALKKYIDSHEGFRPYSEGFDNFLEELDIIV